jgi:hypothetical protein
MRSMTHWPMARLMGGQFSKAGDITLPDYADRQVRRAS